MSRIRSVHPGLFTDEAFVGLSDASQIFLVGLWTEADDQGVFEWKPVTLRMKLRPAKDGAVEDLLCELEAANCIRKYEIGGRHLGAIRNFRKYQRPKFPKSTHTITPEIGKYTGSLKPATEIECDDDDPVPRNEETGALMEDGAKEGEKEKKDSNPKSVKKYAFEEGVIKLTQAHFDRWQRSFKHLNLAAELTGLAEWAGRPENARKWFSAVAGALAKRDRQVLERQEKFKMEAANGAVPVNGPEPPLEAMERTWGTLLDAEQRLGVWQSGRVPRSSIPAEFISRWKQERASKVEPELKLTA